MNAHANPAALIIARFGKIADVSRALGAKYSTVKSWKDRGSIPDEYKVALLDAARRAGIPLSFADFFTCAAVSEECAESGAVSGPENLTPDRRLAILMASPSWDGAEEHIKQDIAILCGFPPEEAARKFPTDGGLSTATR